MLVLSLTDTSPFTIRLHLWGSRPRAREVQGRRFGRFAPCRLRVASRCLRPPLNIPLFRPGPVSPRSRAVRLRTYERTHHEQERAIICPLCDKPFCFFDLINGRQRADHVFEQNSHSAAENISLQRIGGIHQGMLRALDSAPRERIYGLWQQCR